MSKPAIICVDDEPTVLESLKIELKQIVGDTCLIETAESGEEALELFEELQSDKHEVALVLADQIMPDIRGDELLKQIHRLSPKTLSIMIAGHTDVDTLNKAIHTAKLYRYIAKPWHSEDLRSTVLEAIQSYRYTRELEDQTADLQRTVQQLEQSVSSLQQSHQNLKQQAEEAISMSRVFLAVAVQQMQQCQSIQGRVEELEHLNQLKDQFLDAVSHELRSPISNIRMATQMLEVRLQPLDTEENQLQCDRYFQILKTECQRETDLLNDLLALLRLDSGTDSLNLSTVNLNLWMSHIAEPFIERIQEKEQHLRLALPDDLPTITTDLAHLERILTELLQNAWKYTPVGGTITITAQPVAGTTMASEVPGLGEASAPQSAELWISVSNSGTEIPIEEQERIFEQFYRITSSAGQQGGTGLGLAIVRKRVEKLRGEIVLSSQQGETTFTLKLPLHLFDR